jgi:hypothetical protein
LVHSSISSREIASASLCNLLLFLFSRFSYRLAMRRQSKLGGCVPTSGLRPSTSGAFGVNGILPVFSEEDTLEASSAKALVKMVNREELKTRVVEALGASRLVRLPDGGAEAAWQMLVTSGHTRGDLPHPAMSAAQAALKRAFSKTSLDASAARFLTPFMETQCRNCGRTFQPSKASLLEDPCYPHEFLKAQALGDVVESQVRLRFVRVSASL